MMTNDNTHNGSIPNDAIQHHSTMMNAPHAHITYRTRTTEHTQHDGKHNHDEIRTNTDTTHQIPSPNIFVPRISFPTHVRFKFSRLPYFVFPLPICLLRFQSFTLVSPRVHPPFRNQSPPFHSLAKRISRRLLTIETATSLDSHPILVMQVKLMETFSSCNT